MEMSDWFPETVVRKVEDETPNRKGSKYAVILLPVAGVVPIDAKTVPPDLARKPGKPYRTPGGTLVIPVDALPRYRWWAGGISLAAVIAETSGLACPVDHAKV